MTQTKTTSPQSTLAPKPSNASGRIFNFSAGPAVLPEEVILQAQHDLWNVAESGIGVMEHSHRGPVFDRIIDEAEADCRAVGGFGDGYAVLFLQGGATTQFATIPMSYLGKDRIADYIHTGVWTKKAIAEAKLFGDVHLAFDGAESGFKAVPKPDELQASGDPAYTFYCSNNTIYGTEFTKAPPSRPPLICDASSDIFSQPIDVNAHALIFAGAQKNLGPAGCTLVIARRDFLEQATEGLPSMFDYRKHAAKGSRLNTPPTFAIYMMGRVFKWILGQGGLAELAKRNKEKARVIYDAIDANDFYQAVARSDSRSLMNITFRTPGDELDKQFLKEAAAQGMSGLKGHRDVGGLRASVYNAFPIEGCRTLAEFMKSFASRNG